MKRLIDANVFKEDLKQYFSDGVLDSVSAKLAFNMILRKIDEAPTEEPEILMTAKEYNLYLEGYKQGKKDFDRPNCVRCDHFGKGCEKCEKGEEE